MKYRLTFFFLPSLVILSFCFFFVRSLFLLLFLDFVLFIYLLFCGYYSSRSFVGEQTNRNRQQWKNHSHEIEKSFSGSPIVSHSSNKIKIYCAKESYFAFFYLQNIAGAFAHGQSPLQSQELTNKARDYSQIWSWT